MGLSTLERDDVFEFALHATSIAKGFPFGMVCWAVVDVWRYLSGVELADRPVAGLSIANWVITKLCSNVTAFCAVRAKVSAKVAGGLSVLVVDPIAGHYSGPL
ncbi:hypothetical protein AO284_33465 [Pseudomonas sp. NZIPFR-PS2]|nr:hypothetical protein AO284_33465 [Pseudomonas sp. NZIPFR-PS2]